MQNKKNKKNNFKKIFLTIILFILLIISIVIVSLYISDNNFRNFINIQILKLEIYEGQLEYIEINQENTQYIFGYDKYLAVLNKNKLAGYINSSKKEFEFSININVPLSSSNGKYLALAEKNGQKIFVIFGKEIKWQSEIEGEILSININKNGFTSITVAHKNYKSIIIVFDNLGNELFKRYLATTYAIDTKISDDNKKLAFVEINTSAITTSSNIKIISIEKAQNDSENSLEYTYAEEKKALALAIKFTDKNKLICLYDDKINEIYNNETIKLLNLDDENILFTDISSTNYIVQIIKNNVENSIAQIKITNINSNKERLYDLQTVPEKMSIKDDIIILNYGTRVDFINLNGKLIKKYITEKEIKDIYIYNNTAAIFYRYKIELMSI